MEDLEKYFIQLIVQSGSLDIAEAEFKRQLADDSELRAQYGEWCHATGTTERHGFHDFCEEYLENENNIWNSLRDYDDQEI